MSDLSSFTPGTLLEGFSCGLHYLLALLALLHQLGADRSQPAAPQQLHQNSQRRDSSDYQASQEAGITLSPGRLNIREECGYVGLFLAGKRSLFVYRPHGGEWERGQYGRQTRAAKLLVGAGKVRADNAASKRPDTDYVVTGHAGRAAVTEPDGSSKQSSPVLRVACASGRGR